MLKLVFMSRENEQFGGHQSMRYQKPERSFGSDSREKRKRRELKEKIDENRYIFGEDALVVRKFFGELLSGADDEYTNVEFYLNWLVDALQAYRKLEQGLDALSVDEVTSLEKNILSEVNIELQMTRSGGAGGQNVQKNDTAVIATHSLSGFSTRNENERSQPQNKQEAKMVLWDKVWEHLELVNKVVNPNLNIKKEVERIVGYAAYEKLSNEEKQKLENVLKKRFDKGLKLKPIPRGGVK